MYVKDVCWQSRVITENNFTEEQGISKKNSFIMKQLKICRGLNKSKKSDGKKTGEELQQYLAFKRRGAKVDSKKKYTRKKKHKNEEEFK